MRRAAAQREVTVWFNADVSDDMPWEFKPVQEYVKVKPGQSTLVFFNGDQLGLSHPPLLHQLTSSLFTAKNKSDKSITGYSVYNVSPDKVSEIY